MRFGARDAVVGFVEANSSWTAVATEPLQGATRSRELNEQTRRVQVRQAGICSVTVAVVIIARTYCSTHI